MYNGVHLNLLDLLIASAGVKGFSPTLMVSKEGELYVYNNNNYPVGKELVKKILDVCSPKERTNPDYYSLYAAVENCVPH